MTKRRFIVKSPWEPLSKFQIFVQREAYRSEAPDISWKIGWG